MYLSKMKWLILCAALVARIHAEFTSPFPTEYDHIVDICRNVTGYTDEVIEKEKETYFAENRRLRIFNYCFLEKTGFVTRDGKRNIDGALAELTPSWFKDTVELCNKRVKTDEYPESVFSTCFHTGVSIHMRSSLINKVVSGFNRNVTQIVDACRMETGYTDEVIAEEEKSDSNEDKGLKKFNYCFLDKTGFEQIRQFTIDDALQVIPPSNATEIIEGCKSKTIKNIIPDSFPHISACILLGASQYFRTTRVKHRYPVGETQHVVQIVTACQMETGFTDDDRLRGYVSRNFTELKGLKKFNDCFLEKTGFITSDGKLNIDSALAKLKPGFAKPLIEHCQANIILKYITDTVDDFSKCYHYEVQKEIKSIYGFTNYWMIVGTGTNFVKNKFITSIKDADFDYPDEKRSRIH